jgi:hypothetical protein
LAGKPGIREHQPITEKGILRRVSVIIFKAVNSFREANKKFIIVYGSEKHLKDLENHQLIYRKYSLNLFVALFRYLLKKFYSLSGV